MDPQSYLNRSFSEPDIYSNSPHYRRFEVEEYLIPHQLQNSSKPQISEIRRYSFTQIFPISSDLDTMKHNNLIVDNKNRSGAFFEHKSAYANNSYIQSNRNIRYEERFCANMLGNPDFVENSRCNIITHNSEKFDTQSQKSDKMEYLSENQEMPMDIDSYNYSESNKSVDNYTNSESDNNYIENTWNLTDDLKPKVRRLNETSILSTPSKRSKYQISCRTIISILFIVIACLCYLFFIETSHEKSKLSVTLDNILYQDHVKDIIIKNFNELQTGIEQKKILVFVGTTGVGKTYAVNLIRTLFPKKFVIDVNFFLESHVIVDNIQASMRSDGCYFITIDDLKIENLENILSYLENLPDKCALIIPIFNIHDVDDNLVYTMNKDHFKKIEKEFINKFFSQVDIVLFNDIKRDILEKWLKDQIKEKGLVDKEDTINSVLDEHDAEIYGFKGLSAKLNVLGP